MVRINPRKGNFLLGGLQFLHQMADNGRIQQQYFVTFCLGGLNVTMLRLFI